MGAGNTKSAGELQQERIIPPRDVDLSNLDDGCDVRKGVESFPIYFTHPVYHSSKTLTGGKKNQLQKDQYKYTLCFRLPGEGAVDDPRRDVGDVIQMPKEVGNMRLLRSDPFPATGIEGPGDCRGFPLFTAMVESTSKGRFIGKTGKHLYGGAYFGNDVNVDWGDESEVKVQPPVDGIVFNLEVCTTVPESTYALMIGKRSLDEDVLRTILAPDAKLLKKVFVWVDGQNLVTHGEAAAAKEGVVFNVFDSKYIMFVDALTGVVSPGGEDCVTKTHIPIRAEYGGGIHPGQWRVGGEASFGWGGECQFCTNTVENAIEVTKPFDVLCYKPLLPADLQTLLSRKKDGASTIDPRLLLCFVKTAFEGEYVSLPGAFAGFQVVASIPFPAIGGCQPGVESPLNLHCALIQSGIERHLGATTQHIHYAQREDKMEIYFGREISKKQTTHFDNCFGLHLCMVVPKSEFDSFRDFDDDDIEYPLSDFVWLDARTFQSHEVEAAAAKEGAVFNVFDSKYIMFVDALTGVVSPGGVDCVTKTHIPIRAEYGGGIHPGQWRVGGEASFGWGGKCHMCTSHQGADCTVLIPFEILCHRPSLPSSLLKSVI